MIKRLASNRRSLDKDLQILLRLCLTGLVRPLKRPKALLVAVFRQSFAADDPVFFTQVIKIHTISLYQSPQ